MNIKNFNVLLASSTALLGLFIGIKGNDMAKIGVATALASTAGFAVSSVSIRSKKYNRLYEAEKLVSLAKTDKIRLNNEVKELQSKYDGCTQQVKTLNANVVQVTGDNELLTKELQKALGQAARAQFDYQGIQTTLEVLKAEKQQLVEELDETLEDLKFATADIDEVVQINVSEATAVIHDEYKARMMINVEKLAQGRFDAKSKGLLEQVQGVTLENENLRKEVERYEVEFSEVQNALNGDDDPFDFAAYVGEHTSAYQTRITELSTQIEMLEAQLAQATAPQKFPAGRDYDPGNQIIDWVWNSRSIPVDGVWRSVSGTNETFYFQLRSTKDINPVKQCINASLEDLRIATAVKQISPIEWDTEKALLKLSVTNHVQIIDKNAIEKLWIPAHRFPSLVGNWQRIRITGASEGQKSPLVRNLLGAKLMNGEKFDLVRFDPSGGSQKDYWRLEADSNDFAELPGILKRMKDDAFSQARKESKEKITRLYTIDEIDSCFGRVKDPMSMSTGIKDVLKHGSHTGVGIILCGQNANVSTYPGFQRSDFNSGVNIHIGLNIMDALTNNNDASKVTELIQNARILLDYCAKQNEGVDPVDRLQVALVEERGKRYFIQLPRLGEYGFDKQFPGTEYDFPAGFSTADYDDGLKSLNQALLSGKRVKSDKVLSDATSSKVPPVSVGVMAETVDISWGNNGVQNAVNPNVSLPCNPPKPQVPHCPHCESDKLGSKDSKRYVCKSCKKSFAKSKALVI